MNPDISGLRADLEAALSDCEADFPGMSQDPGVYWDLVQAVVISSDASTQQKREFCRTEGVRFPHQN